jgi:hypothetical protein
MTQVLFANMAQLTKYDILFRAVRLESVGSIENNAEFPSATVPKSPLCESIQHINETGKID